MLDYLRKHTIVIMAAMALVFVGLMFVGGDVSGGSLTGMFKQTFVSVDGKSYGEKDYNNMGRTGLSVAFSFPSTFGPLLQDNFSSEENLRELCHLLKTNNPNAAFLAYRGIIRREAGRLGLTPSTAEIDDAICNIPEFQDDKGVFDPQKYDNFISMRGNMGKKLQEELLRGLMEFKRAYDLNLRVKNMLPDLYAEDPDFYRNMRIQDLAQGIHRLIRQHDLPRLMLQAFDVLPEMKLTPHRAWQRQVKGEVETVELENLVGRVSANMILPYPPGVPLLMPGEMITEESRAVLDFLLMLCSVGRHYPGFETDIHGAKRDDNGVYWVRVLK